MWKTLDLFKLNSLKHCLIVMVSMPVLMSAKVWPNDFGNHQAIIYTLSPSLQNYMLMYESSLCSSSNITINPPPHNNILCQQKPIVRVLQLGRLGNQTYESVAYRGGVGVQSPPPKFLRPNKIVPNSTRL